MKICLRKKKPEDSVPEADSKYVEKCQGPDKECSSNLVRGFACPYSGCSFGSCQDSLYADVENAFFSVVDGVSEGMGQSYYVMLLSRYNSDTDTVRITSLDAQNIHSKWEEYQETLIAEGRMRSHAYNLYKEGKHAHSTYIRIKFYLGEDKAESIRWKCAVLGDSALIHARRTEDGLKIMHVMMSNENVRRDNFIYSDSPNYYDFSQAPDQLDENGTWIENEAYLEDESCEVGDLFILATDHVSAWILENSDFSIPRVENLLSVLTQEEFQELVDREREDNPDTGYSNMGDDDSTALIIEIRNPRSLDFNVTAMIDPREKYKEEKALIESCHKEENAS